MRTAIFALIGFVLIALYLLLVFRENRRSLVNKDNVTSWLLALVIAVFIYHSVFLVVALSTQFFLWLCLVLGLSLVFWFYFGYSYIYQKLTFKDGAIHFISAGVMALTMLIFFIFSII